MIKKTGAALAALLLFGAGAAWAATSNPTTERINGADTAISGCVIRFNPERTGQPDIHANNSHYCAGVDRVGIAANGRMRVVQNSLLAVENPVVFTICQVDETLARQGIICGPTGGTNHTEYQFYDTKLNRPLNLKKKSDRMRLAVNNVANVWIGWVHAPGATQ